VRGLVHYAFGLVTFFVLVEYLAASLIRYLAG